MSFHLNQSMSSCSHCLRGELITTKWGRMLRKCGWGNSKRWLVKTSTRLPCIFVLFMVPTSTWKLGKWEYIFQPGKSRNFEHTGKVREYYPKYWKREGILPIFIFIFFHWFFIWGVFVRFLYLLNALNKTLEKNNGKWKKYWQSQGN